MSTDASSSFVGTFASRQLGLVALLAACYLVGIAIYRLYLSPLAKIPGPKLAALTSWYNGYFDIVKGGQYVWEIEKMHQKYGPIVRTRPDAVHVNDPAFIDKLYTQSPKLRRERFHTVVNAVIAPGSILSTVDHDLHRRRRAVLNPYFSKERVRRLEPIVNASLVDLMHRMDRWAAAGPTPIHLNTPLRAATTDIIRSYAFGDLAGATKCLDMEDCNTAFFEALTPQRVCHVGTHAFYLASAMANMPPALTKLLVPRVGVFAEFMESLSAQIEVVRHARDLPEGKTIFHEVMRSEALPEAEKENRRLVDEAMVILIAGSETTASTLAAITYHLLADRAGLLRRLRAELTEAMPDPNELPAAARLDSLRLLNAVIHEALRLYPGATHRQDRTAPDEDLVLEDRDRGVAHVIPRGAGVGMTAPLINRHPGIYGADADEFRPDRYLEDPALAGRYQMAFSRGARQCIGINLAYQELQTLTAGLFRRYDAYDPSRGEGGQAGPTMELYGTERRDVSMHSDYFTPGQWEGSRGLRVVFRR